MPLLRRFAPVAALLFAVMSSVAPRLRAQNAPHTYTNPVLFSDYSDPDVIRDGNTFYLVASTFEFAPGLPILSSPDLVHWTIMGHALPRIELAPQYDLKDGNRYGRGVWAPALRKHNGRFYLYFPTPDEGIFVITAPSLTGPWSKPVALLSGPGYEDPCPFWDDNGDAYLIHSMKGAGPLIVHRMAPDGLSLLDKGTTVIHDLEHFRALEGPKIYKRHGWYYIWAPFGGFSTGSQIIFRSKSLFGPFEHRVALSQGSTEVNGPHQGAYVETPDGTGWFLHFRLDGGYGRIDYLEPVRWQDDWPLIGDPAHVETTAGISTGQPVRSAPLPVVTSPPATQRPQTSDEFSATALGPQWEWNHNPVDALWSLTARPGFLRLAPAPAIDLFTARNTLTQQMQDENLDYTVRLDLSRASPGTHAGLAMLESKASGLDVITAADGKRTLRFFHYTEFPSAGANTAETHPMHADVTQGPSISAPAVELRVHIAAGEATYSYSVNEGRTFTTLGPSAPLTFSWWKGSRPAVFAWTEEAPADAPATARSNPPNHDGYVDLDWARQTPLLSHP